MTDLANFLDSNKNDTIQYIGRIDRYVPASDDVFGKLVNVFF